MKFGLYDTQRDAWLGNSAGPLLRDTLEQASAELAALKPRLGAVGEHVIVRPYEASWKAWQNPAERPVKLD